MVSIQNSIDINEMSGFVDYIYVTNQDSDTVSVIDAHNNTVIKNIPVGSGPSDIKTFGDYIYVATSGTFLDLLTQNFHGAVSVI